MDAKPKIGACHERLLSVSFHNYALVTYGEPGLWAYWHTCTNVGRGNSDNQSIQEVVVADTVLNNACSSFDHYVLHAFRLETSQHCPKVNMTCKSMVLALCYIKGDAESYISPYLRGRHQRNRCDILLVRVSATEDRCEHPILQWARHVFNNHRKIALTHWGAYSSSYLSTVVKMMGVLPALISAFLISEDCTGLRNLESNTMGVGCECDLNICLSTYSSRAGNKRQFEMCTLLY